MLSTPPHGPRRAEAGDPDVPSAARWQSIAGELRDELLRGRYPPGQRLPNEQELARRFGVNRHTLRQAMQALVREGHVQVRQGCGTFARDLVVDYALQRRTRLSENLARAGVPAQRELLWHRREPAAAWATALRVRATSGVVVLQTRASVRGRPIGLSTAAFPCPRLAGIAPAVQDSGSITLALRALGVADYTRLRSVVTARLPTAAEADLLARAAGQAVLVVQYVNADGAGVPVEAGSTVFAADAVQLTVEPDAPPP